MTEIPLQSPQWASFCLLIQQLIAGTVRRNTFSQWEMELLLDLQMVHIRKSSRSETLRRYLKVVQRQLALGAPEPPRFSRFFEAEAQSRKPAEVASDNLQLPRAS